MVHIFTFQTMFKFLLEILIKLLPQRHEVYGKSLSPYGGMHD